MHKELETIIGQEKIPYNEVTFGLYAREDIMTENSTAGIKKDSLLDVINIDEHGKGTFNADLPAGNYYAKELSTAKGYCLDTKEYDIHFEYADSKEADITICLNEGKPIMNNLIKGSIEIIKTSEDSKIEGISFLVKDNTEIGTSFEQIFVTNKDGRILIENIPAGTYEITEVKDNKTVGYILPDSQTVTVSEEKTVVEVENKLIRGGFRLLKTDENGTALSGVKFGLFKKDGTRLLEFETDKNGMYSLSDLGYGDYYLQELEAKKGYTFDKEEIYAFTVAEHEQIIEIHAVNEKIPDKPYTPSTPQTGDNSVDKRIYLAFGIFSAVSAGLFLILYRRKKSGK